MEEVMTTTHGGYPYAAILESALQGVFIVTRGFESALDSEKPVNLSLGTG
jgi:hypothetical protein